MAKKQKNLDKVMLAIRRHCCVKLATEPKTGYTYIATLDDPSSVIGIKMWGNLDFLNRVYGYHVTPLDYNAFKKAH